MATADFKWLLYLWGSHPFSVTEANKHPCEPCEREHVIRVNRHPFITEDHQCSHSNSHMHHRSITHEANNTDVMPLHNNHHN